MLHHGIYKMKFIHKIKTLKADFIIALSKSLSLDKNFCVKDTKTEMMRNY